MNSNNLLCKFIWLFQEFFAGFFIKNTLENTLFPNTQFKDNMNHDNNFQIFQIIKKHV